MKYSFTIVLMLFFFTSQCQVRKGISLPADSNTICLTTELGVPFGDVCKLQVEVYPGDKLGYIAYRSAYLLKINSINGKSVTDTLVLRFTDETETLANNDFDLYKLIYKKSTGSLSSSQITQMQKRYVGKKITIMAYETGQFTGIPAKYFDYNYTPPGVPHWHAGTSFFFEHSLVVISNITTGK